MSDKNKNNFKFIKSKTNKRTIFSKCDQELITISNFLKKLDNS